MNDWRSWAMVAALLSAWPPAAAAADRDEEITAPAMPQPILIVRVYDAAHRPASELHRALREAEALLSSGSVDVIWESCADPNREPCRRPLGAVELAVRLVNVPVDGRYRGTLPLGNSLIVPAGHHGTLATVYIDRVQWLAVQAGADLALLLGRTVAHEIGHLLIGTARHATHGLMRARWSREELQRNRPADWQFTLQDGIDMRRGVLARSDAGAPDALVWNRQPRHAAERDRNAAY